MKLRRVQKALRCTYGGALGGVVFPICVSISQAALWRDLMISCGTFIYSIVIGAIVHLRITCKHA